MSNRRRYRPDMPEWFAKFVEQIRTMTEEDLNSLLTTEGEGEGLELFDMIKKEKSISLSTYTESKISPEQQASDHNIDLDLYYPVEIRTKVYHQGSKLTIDGKEQVVVTPLHYLSVKWGLKSNSTVESQQEYIKMLKQELSMQILNTAEQRLYYANKKQEGQKENEEGIKNLIDSVDKAFFDGNGEEGSKKILEEDLIRTLKPTYGVEIMITDLHLGKVGFDPITLKHNWSLEQAGDHMLEAIDQTIRTVGINNIDHFILPLGNDYLNIDSTANTTTAGTPQMTNEFWFNIFKFGKELETLSAVAPVFVYMVNGNHDNDSVFTLGEVLSAYFLEDDNVTITNDMLRHPGHVFGENLIMYHHGNKIKMANFHKFALLHFAEYAACKHKAVHLGHFHVNRKTEIYDLKRKNEDAGIEIEICPSLSPVDKWHRDNLYVGNIRRSKSFVYDKDKGLVQEIYYNI